MQADRVLHKYPERLASWLEAHGFRLTEARDFHSMDNAVVVFDADAYRLRFYLDRGEPWENIASWAAPKEWQDLTLFVSLFGDHPLTKFVTPEQVVALLEEHHETLCDMFSEENYPQTREALSRLGRKRARLQFPGAFPDDDESQ